MTQISSEINTHFCAGYLPFAFVFSVPGAVEKLCNRPISGVTGENLDFAISYLNTHCQSVFKSKCRYAYRITNSYPEPIAKSLGHNRSQPTDSQVLEEKNITRFIKEIDGFKNIILCGKKAQLLATKIDCNSDINIFFAPHLSNQSLSRQQYRVTGETSRDRRIMRTECWAKNILDSLREKNGCDALNHGRYSSEQIGRKVTYSNSI